MKSPVAIFTQINKISLYLAIFLIPLFFLPFARDVLDYPKQLLFLFLVFLSLISWLGKQLLQGKIILKENKLLYLTLFLLLILFSFSTIFSLWPAASFWGWPLITTDNFLTFFSFLLLFFLFVNTFEESEIFFGLLLLLISGTISALFVLLQLYGIFILPFDFAQIVSFNTLGDIYQAAIFLAVLLLPSLVLVFLIKKPIFWLFFLILLTAVLLIDFNTAWIIVLLGILILSIFGLSGPKGEIRGGLALALMFLLVLSIFFLFFPLRFSGFPVLSPQVSPSLTSEMEILRSVYGEGIKSNLFGTGPGTFIFDYSKYRSPFLNQTFFWGIRFPSGSSEFLDWFIGKGFLGGIFFLFFLGLMIYFGLKGLTFQSSKAWGNEMRLAFLASVISLIGAGFLSPFNFSLWFLFWVIIAGLSFYHLKEREIEINSRFRGAVFSTIIFIITISGLALLMLQGQKYLAEVNYSKGIKFFQQGDVDQAINFTKKATFFNPAVDIYWRDLSQFYLAKANLIAQTEELAPEEKRKLTQENITKGVESLNQAISFAPFNVANWNVRGFFYRNLIGIPQAGEIALESYRRAAELEPASPFPYAEMGRTHILIAQDFREKRMPDAEKESLTLAIENLEKSIKLKSDYAPAHYLIAVVYDQQGKTEEAIGQLEKIKNFFPQDIGMAFRLGMLYWRKERLEEAQREFERIINLNPDYSNAKYMLGLVYDKKGEKEKAKEQFEEVSQLNPENQEVVKILENLKKGLPALEGIIPSQPPIGEVPPEIQK